MTIRIRTFAPPTALAAAAPVPLLPTAAQAQPRPQTAAPVLARLPAGYCCQDLTLAGDPRVLPALDHAGLSVPADVGVGCHPLDFTPEQRSEAGRWGLLGPGCVPAGSSQESERHRARPEAVTAA
ncbi:hypothetical protein [Streptomyces sp. NPDC005374]|uniref:hypothetical protein n=1 Tax=Streptomyces sp. NPDC005374 TaxID=3364713 RepID=UPI0036C28DBA